MPEISIILIPIITGLVQIVKQLNIASRWIPVVAIAFGILGGIFFVDAVMAWRVLWGIVFALASMGLWSGVRSVAGK